MPIFVVKDQVQKKLWAFNCRNGYSHLLVPKVLLYIINIYILLWFVHLAYVLLVFPCFSIALNPWFATKQQHRSNVMDFLISCWCTYDTWLYEYWMNYDEMAYLILFSTGEKMAFGYKCFSEDSH